MGSLVFCLKLDTGELLSSRFSKSNTPVKAKPTDFLKAFVHANNLRKFYSDLPNLTKSTATT